MIGLIHLVILVIQIECQQIAKGLLNQNNKALVINNKSINNLMPVRPYTSAAPKYHLCHMVKEVLMQYIYISDQYMNTRC